MKSADTGKEVSVEAAVNAEPPAIQGESVHTSAERQTSSLSDPNIFDLSGKENQTLEYAQNQGSFSVVLEFSDLLQI